MKLRMPLERGMSSFWNQKGTLVFNKVIRAFFLMLNSVQASYLLWISRKIIGTMRLLNMDHYKIYSFLVIFLLKSISAFLIGT